MKKIIKYFFLAMLLAVLGSYIFVTNYGLKGSGIIETDTRELASFSKISLSELGTIHVSFGDTQSVTVTTDDNLIEFIETIVSDGELDIRPSKTLNPGTSIVINVTVPQLSDVDLAGKASLFIHDIDAESLDIQLAGACGVDGTGRIGNLTLEMAGACRARLKPIVAEHAVVDIAGTGSAVVFAKQSIDASASGIASITCHGNPEEVKKEANGICRVTIVGS